MRRHLRSYLVRVWDWNDGTIRVEIEHIQDGTHVVVDSLAVALSWIESRAVAHASAVSVSEPGPVRNGSRAEDEPPS